MQLVWRYRSAFTLLELLVAIAIIGILAAVVIVAINPADNIDAANDATRRIDINVIGKAIYQYQIDFGQLPSTFGRQQIDSVERDICIAEGFFISLCELPPFHVALDALVPVYLPKIPIDPDINPEDTNEIASGYRIRQLDNGRIEVSAPNATTDEPLVETF